VIVPTFVESIGGLCFDMIEAHDEDSFENKSKLRQIYQKVFAYMSLKGLMLPKSVERIDGSAFLWTKLTSIAAESGSERFVVSHGLVHDVIDAKIVLYFGNFGKVVIPHLIEKIVRMVFSMCKTIEEVAFDPESRLKRIGQSAFSESSLKQIFI
jgi:hypothetical protein